MNIRIYKQIGKDRMTEESLYNVIKIEETDDFGYVFTMVEPYTNETITREIPKEDVMWIQFNVIMKFSESITNKFKKDIKELIED